ncbi:hypothetical protein AB0C33_20160 [Nonomuraea sp. NPDC048881]|uniref:hypothetical protein n=1 Tax=Nonomuraea sp. NPDC048881 TaxID=3155030 RepID=UPI0033C2CBDD
MSLTITDTRISSDRCPNVAELGAGGWTVTGYPGRLFDRDAATTAMLLAELLALTLPTAPGITQAVGPQPPTADHRPTDRPDESRPDRTSSLTVTWGAASSAKTTTAPQDPTTHQAAEVPSS